MKILLFVRDIARNFPFLILVNTGLLVVSGVIDAASILTLAPVVEFLIHSDLEAAGPVTRSVAEAMAALGLPVTLGMMLSVFLVLNVLRGGFQILIMHLIFRTKYAVLRDLTVGTFDKFFHARWRFFSSGSQGTFLNTFIRETSVVGEAFGAMAAFFAGVFQVLLYLAVPLYISWQVTLISVSVGVLLALPFLVLGRVSYRLGRDNTSTSNRMSGVIQESLGCAKVVLGFGNQDKSIASLGEAFDAHRAATLRSQTLGYAIPRMYFPLGLFVIIVALLVTRRFALPLSELSVLIYALWRVIPTLGSLTGQKSSIENFFPSYEQVIGLRREAEKLAQRTGSLEFEGFHDRIAVEDLSFAHPGYPDSLSSVNVVIPKGKMVAFVGESGGGKSTLVDMIMGFHEPGSGRVTIDGVALEKFDIVSYRRRVGYVPQESILFSMSVRDNLVWAKEDATREEMEEACRLARADEFIERLPDGYDTMVGDRGVRLSGGQVQRIALARAVLRGPDILVLDEATSSLDTESERLIQESVERVAKGRTVIVVAHRLSTITSADRVYVIEGGRVFEEGTYDELLKRGGRFKRMVELQALGTYVRGEGDGVLEEVSGEKGDLLES